MSDALDPEDMPSGGFVALIGLELHDLGPDRVTASLEAGPQHHQPTGLVHGGVYSTIVESLASLGGWMAVRDRGLGVVGVHNATDFLRAHREGRLEAEAHPVYVGRTQQLWEVVITRAADDKVVARGQVRLQNIPAYGPAQGDGSASS